MKKAIVTGANGFVGGAVTRELIENGYQVTALDQAGCLDAIPQGSACEAVACDLSAMGNLETQVPAGEYEAMYHFAWAGSAGPLRADTRVQLQNAQWTVESLRAAKALGCKRFVCAGSIVERETIAAVFTQGNKPGPAYVYGTGKLAAHALCMSVAAEIGIELVWPLITNAYGVGERSPRLVNTTLRKCLRGEEPQFTSGTQNYDFVYITDVARAFRLIGERGKPFYEYVVGSSAARPLREFLLEMRRAVAPELPFHFGSVPFTGVNLPLSQFDCGETEADTGFRAQIGFGEGCKRTADWWKTALAAEEQR